MTLVVARRVRRVPRRSRWIRRGLRVGWMVARRASCAGRRLLAMVLSGLGLVWFTYGQLSAAVARLWCALPFERRSREYVWCRRGGSSSDVVT